MLKEYAAVFKILAFLSDAFILTGVVLFLSFYYGIEPYNYKFFFVLFILLSLYFFKRAGMYRSFRARVVKSLIYSVFKSLFASFALSVLAAYVAGESIPQRPFLFYMWGAVVVAVTAERFFLVEILHYIRKKGFNFRRLLIVGNTGKGREFIRKVRRHPEWGFHIVGIVCMNGDNVGKTVEGVKIISSIDNILGVVREYYVDEVVVIAPHDWMKEVGEYIASLEVEGIRVSVSLDSILNMPASKILPELLFGDPFVTFESAPDKMWALFTKRCIDIAVAVFFLILLFPLMVVIGVLIKTDSRGNIFFCQERLGKGGKKFLMYKFRTMYKGAENDIDKVASLNKVVGAAFKAEDDPRVTRVGKILRKFSLDELPQLINVLKGDMSIVGPRPPIGEEVKRYKPWQRRRMSMPPGMTCLWQIRGRDEITDFDKRVEMDLEYIDNWSLYGDFVIMLKTIPVVLLGKGVK